MSFKTLKPVDCIATGTRWLLGPEGSFNASWAGQSLAFMFTGSLLKLKVGSNTMRKDPDNGRTPMIAISTAAAYNATNLWDAPTFDPCAGDELTVVDSKESIKTVVQLMLIDWASAFELEALITDSVLAPVFRFEFLIHFASLRAQRCSPSCPPPHHAHVVRRSMSTLSCAFQTLILKCYS